MAWYPGAERTELQPESDGQPAIVPTQLILHSIAAPWTPRRIYEYWRDSTNLESHFGLGFDGSLGQYIGTQTRADANMHANLRPDGTGAVSVESASNLQHTDPWTDAQVEALIRLGVWMHQQHGIPLRICRTWDDPGYGVHRMFPQWSDGGTACPGDARVRQFHELVFPGIVARATGTAAPAPTPAPTPAPVQEDDMTPEELLTHRVPLATLPGGYVPSVEELLNGAKAADSLIEGLRADLPALLLNAPMPQGAALSNGYVPTVWEAINGAQTAGSQIAALTAQMTAQGVANAAALTALSTLVAQVHGLDVAAVGATVEAAVTRALATGTVSVDVQVHNTTTPKG
jgi:hypothetical protein